MVDEPADHPPAEQEHWLYTSALRGGSKVIIGSQVLHAMTPDFIFSPISCLRLCVLSTLEGGLGAGITLSNTDQTTLGFVAYDRRDGVVRRYESVHGPRAGNAPVQPLSSGGGEWRRVVRLR